jgi:hypothetical protein
MTIKVRTYTWSKNPVNGRDILTMHARVGDMPFGVWRDLGRLAGKSYDNLAGHCVYEFLLPNKREEAKRILDGGMWEEREGHPTPPADYEACGYCGFDHDYEPAQAHKWHTDNPGEGYDS